MSPPSSLGWLGRTVALLALMGHIASAADLSYSLVDDYTPANWFDMFSFDSVSLQLQMEDAKTYLSVGQRYRHSGPCLVCWQFLAKMCSR